MLTYINDIYEWRTFNIYINVKVMCMAYVWLVPKRQKEWLYRECRDAISQLIAKDGHFVYFEYYAQL